MFVNKTAFILGAGASWHYGYPVGESLVHEVTSRALKLAEFLQQRKRIANVPQLIEARIPNPLPAGHTPWGYWEVTERECRELNARLRNVHPLVIDYFLAQNPDLQTVGRFLIAWIILECDSQWQQTKKNQNLVNGPYPPRDKWCRFLLHKLTSDCRTGADLLKNNVTFVTFNYDVSLERELYEGLSSIEMFARATDVPKRFFSDDRFLHVYGKVRDCPPLDFPKPDEFVALASQLMAMEQ